MRKRARVTIHQTKTSIDHRAMVNLVEGSEIDARKSKDRLHTSPFAGKSACFLSGTAFY